MIIIFNGDHGPGLIRTFDLEIQRIILFQKTIFDIPDHFCTSVCAQLCDLAVIADHGNGVAECADIICNSVQAHLLICRDRDRISRCASDQSQIVDQRIAFRYLSGKIKINSPAVLHEYSAALCNIQIPGQFPAVIHDRSISGSDLQILHGIGFADDTGSIAAVIDIGISAQIGDHRIGF